MPHPDINTQTLRRAGQAKLQTPNSEKTGDSLRAKKMSLAIRFFPGLFGIN